MSIEKLEILRSKLNYKKFLMSSFAIEEILDNIIPLFKDIMVDMHQINEELAKKENAIDISNIKEVKRING